MIDYVPEKYNYSNNVSQDIPQGIFLVEYKLYEKNKEMYFWKTSWTAYRFEKKPA